MTELDILRAIQTLDATLPGLAFQATGIYQRACSSVRSRLLRQRAPLKTHLAALGGRPPTELEHAKGAVVEVLAVAEERAIAAIWDDAGRQINGLILSQGAEDEL